MSTLFDDQNPAFSRQNPQAISEEDRFQCILADMRLARSFPAGIQQPGFHREIERASRLWPILYARAKAVIDQEYAIEDKHLLCDPGNLHSERDILSHMPVERSTCVCGWRGEWYRIRSIT